jgi:chromosome partitioning protein
MIITVGNTKGGVGKTSLALNLAIARSMAGHDVWLIDGDRQGSASTALQIRSEAGRTPTISTAQYTEGAVLRAQVMHQKSKFDDIVIDAGGRDSSALRAALALSDVVLIPFQPRSFDAWALQDIAALVREVRDIGHDIRAYAVLSMADTAGQDNHDAGAALAAYPDLELMDTPIRRRKSVANAVGVGLSVLEMPPADQKAVFELKALYSKVFGSVD